MKKRVTFIVIKSQIQIATMCLTISLSATVALVCLYVPKVYIIVFHPDKNVRKLTMSATYRKTPNRQGTTTSIGGGSAAGIAAAAAGVAAATAKASNHSTGTCPLATRLDLVILSFIRGVNLEFP